MINNQFFFNSKYLKSLSDKFSDKFKSAKPFKHVVIDNFLPNDLAINISKEQLKNSKDWIVINQTMNFLEKMAQEDNGLRNWLLIKLALISKDKRKAVSKKAMEILKSLNK